MVYISLYRDRRIIVNKILTTERLRGPSLFIIRTC